MALISRLRDRRFCAFCKAPRRVYIKKHVDLTNVLAVAALSAVMTYAWLGGPDPEGLVIFCVLIFVSEFFVYLRWRLSLKCQMCGFDPVLYKRSPQEASKKVNEFFHTQMQRPEFQLSQSPLLQLQKQLLENERQSLHRARRSQALANIAKRSAAGSVKSQLGSGPKTPQLKSDATVSSKTKVSSSLAPGKTL